MNTFDAYEAAALVAIFDAAIAEGRALDEDEACAQRCEIHVGLEDTVLAELACRACYPAKAVSAS